MPYDIDSLRAVIKTGTEGMDFKDLLAINPPATQAIADRLNEKSIPVQTSILCADFIDILYREGIFDKLLDAYLAGAKEVTREVEKIKLLKQLGIDRIDLSREETVKSLSAVGIPQEIMAMIAEKSTVLRSRAELLWGNDTVVAEIDVRRVVWGDSGDKKL